MRRRPGSTDLVAALFVTVGAVGAVAGCGRRAATEPPAPVLPAVAVTVSTVRRRSSPSPRGPPAASSPTNRPTWPRIPPAAWSPRRSTWASSSRKARCSSACRASTPGCGSTKHARGQPRGGQPQARRIAERIGAEDGPALRVASRNRRRLDHRGRPGTHGRRDLRAERQHRARHGRTGTRPACARRKGCRRRGGRRAVRRIHQPASGLLGEDVQPSPRSSRCSD